MKTRRKRTEKVFVDYNDYKDRPFGLKWGTAFAIDELNKVIEDNQNKERISITELPQMSMEEIDKVLQVAFLKSKKVSIQLNIKDEMGNYGENLIGTFDGSVQGEYVYVNRMPLEWDWIRHIAVLDS